MTHGLKIAHVIPDFGLGGIQKAGCVLGEEMAAAGHECIVIGSEDGPRFRVNTGPDPCWHRVAHTSEIARIVGQFQADVVHVHHASYREDLIHGLIEASPSTLVVSTPVFGRPPASRGTLNLTRTCCVGVYTFYRLAQWLRLRPEDALRSHFGFVPLTPFFTTEAAASAPRSPGDLADARRAIGIPPDGLYVGRIARNTTSKWSTNSRQLVDTLLEADPGIRWLSVGYPVEFGREALRSRWGDRFHDFRETTDQRRLVTITRALDLQIFFSRYGECFASSICEAAGEGVPTIALATPFFDNGQSEQVIDGRTGFLVRSVEAARSRVLALLAEPSRLRELKDSTSRHARQHWCSRNVAANLVSLYQYWKSGTRHPPPYVDTMITEHTAFASGYRSRMLSLEDGGGLARLRFRIALGMYENWVMFAAARRLRRLAYWW